LRRDDPLAKFGSFAPTLREETWLSPLDHSPFRQARTSGPALDFRDRDPSAVVALTGCHALTGVKEPSIDDGRPGYSWKEVGDGLADSSPKAWDKLLKSDAGVSAPPAAVAHSQGRSLNVESAPADAPRPHRTGRSSGRAARPTPLN